MQKACRGLLALPALRVRPGQMVLKGSSVLPVQQVILVLLVLLGRLARPGQRAQMVLRDLSVLPVQRALRVPLALQGLQAPQVLPGPLYR